jgi:hypothetical protein
VAKDEEKNPEDRESDAPEADGDEPTEKPSADADKGRRHASTEGVAKALGVDDEDAEEGSDGSEGEDEEQAKAAPNRKERRRQQAIARRDARRGGAKASEAEGADDGEAEGEDSEAAEGSDDEGEEESEAKKPRQRVARAADPLPKDKNARAKELLRRRREALEKKQDIGLTTGEVVQDQLARAAAGTGRWFTRHFRKIVAALILGAAGAGAFILYTNNVEAKAGAASDEIFRSVQAETALVFEGETKDTRREEEKLMDPRPVFTSQAARHETLMAGYTKAAEQKETGLGILGVLGVAGGHLQKGEYDAAVAKYEEVQKSALAKADVDVQARATEGRGLVLEAKKDLDGALAQFTELEKLDKQYAELGKYHQARMYAAKGDKAKAKELLVAIEKVLEKPSLEDGGQKPQPHLRTLATEALRAIDPSAAPKRSPFGGFDGKPSEAEIQRIMEQMTKDPHGDHGGE